MKLQLSLISAVVGSALMFASIGSKADSSYGYNAAGTGSVKATANVKITVNIPLLVLLRVGSSAGTIDNLIFNASPSAPTGISADGDSLAIDWDGTAPVFVATAGTPVTLKAYGWTNAVKGAELSCTETNDFPTGFAATDITVASAGTLIHPGANGACAGPATPFGANTVATSDWTYGVNATALAAAPAGSYSQTITYTATTL